MRGDGGGGGGNNGILIVSLSIGIDVLKQVIHSNGNQTPGGISDNCGNRRKRGLRREIRIGFGGGRDLDIGGSHGRNCRVRKSKLEVKTVEG